MEVATIKSVLHELIQDIEGTRLNWERAVIAAWQEAVGAKAASHTRILGVRRQTLVVAVDSSPWLYLLSLYKGKILNKLIQDLPSAEIKEIQFKTGQVIES